jgi:sugar (pentulose or hexulose) kinase
MGVASLGEVVVSGGGATSQLFMQIFADVFGIPASRTVGPSGASLGAAICAAVATGVHPDFQTAVARMTQPRQSFAPNAANAEAYRRLNAAVYRDIREATDPVHERSFPIFH